jgi:Ribonuclease G/E
MKTMLRKGLPDDDETCGITLLEGFVPMKLRDIFNSDRLKDGKKRKALKKVLNKLEKKRDKLEIEFRAATAKKKRKDLLLKLKTNKRHRRKAKELIADLH